MPLKELANCSDSLVLILHHAMAKGEERLPNCHNMDDAIP